MNFDFLFTAFGSVLAAMYELRQSYALMIIGLTLLVMIIVTPLTLKATRSMLMMQQLQPELKKLQSKYKDDRQQLNEEMLKFYKENNINPVGGCLPLLIQTPVFLVLYSVLRGLTLRVPVTGGNVGSVVGQTIAGKPITTPPQLIHSFDPHYLPKDSELFQSLHGAIEMRSIGLDLARSASDILATNVVESLPYFLLIAVVAVTSYVQQRQIRARNTGATAINPQQEMIMKIMPFFLPVFSVVVPAGLVLYFVVSNTYRVGQQWFISRNIYGKADLPKPDAAVDAQAKASPSGSGGSGGLMGWLEKLSGQAPAEPEVEEAPAPKKKVSGGLRPAKSAARSGGGRTTPKPAAKGGSKAGAERGSGSTRNGRDRSGATASKQKAGSRTSNASGSGSRATSAKRTSGSSEADSSTRPPTLQPRARKNKKR